MRAAFFLAPKNGQSAARPHRRDPRTACASLAAIDENDELTILKIDGAKIAAMTYFAIFRIKIGSILRHTLLYT
jgi:hypothetical protein